MTIVRKHDHHARRRRSYNRLAMRVGGWMQLWTIVSSAMLVLAYFEVVSWVAAAIVAFGQSVLVFLAWLSMLMADRHELRRRDAENEFRKQELGVEA